MLVNEFNISDYTFDEFLIEGNERYKFYLNEIIKTSKLPQGQTSITLLLMIYINPTNKIYGTFLWQEDAMDELIVHEFHSNLIELLEYTNEIIPKLVYYN